MIIRKATHKDVSALSRLVASLSNFYINSNQAMPDWFSKSIRPSSFAERIMSKDFTSLVAEQQGIIGYICLKGNDHLYHLFVDKGHQKQGVATALWNELISIRDIRTCTLRSSLNAVPIYKKFGYEICGPTTEYMGLCYQQMKWEAKSYDYA